MEKKPIYSKTLWLNFIVALCAIFFPGAGSYIAAHPEVVLAVFSGLNILLRLISKDKISLGD